MSYFSQRRTLNNDARRTAIDARKDVPPFAEYDGGKYEMKQYEGDDVKTGYCQTLQNVPKSAYKTASPQESPVAT